MMKEYFHSWGFGNALSWQLHFVVMFLPKSSAVIKLQSKEEKTHTDFLPSLCKFSVFH